MRELCSKCQKKFIMSTGDIESTGVLLVKEYPTPDEVIRGVPFAGKAGDIVEREFSLLGMYIHQFRSTMLWLHEKDEDGCDINIHMKELMKELSKAKVALMMGGELSQIFCDGKGISKVSGLIMKSDLCPDVTIVMAPNPSSLMHGAVGEYRLAVTRFKEVLKKKGIV